MSAPEPTSERTALYRLYDAEDRLLYVGITANVKQRWIQHAANKIWWSSVVRRDVEWFSSRDEAAIQESIEIQAKRPIYNIHGTASATNSLEGIVPGSSMPVYRQIADVLRSRIISGEYAPGDRIPGENPLMKQYNVSRNTARDALAVLVADGLTDTRRGSGSFVRPEHMRPSKADLVITIPNGHPVAAVEALAQSFDRMQLVALTQALVAKLAD